jgi:hypothetical protein
MYDFWFTLGSAIMDASIFANIQTAVTASAFTLLQSRRIVDTDTTGAVIFDKTNTKTAGVLPAPSAAGVPSVTDGIRKSIRGFIQGNDNAPPVGIYTAGKFSQLLTIPWIDSATRTNFAGVMRLATQAYGNAAAGTRVDELPDTFPALVGLCLIDHAMAGLIPLSSVTTPDGPALQPVMAEFQISSNPQSLERQILSKFVHDPNFQTAATLLQQGDSTPWQEVCGEQYFFWDPQNERAVI